MNNRRLLYIDGLKGIGCIIVFIFHYFSTFNTFLYGLDFAYARYSPLNIFVDGIWAVRVFVILSAFSISYSLTQGSNVQNIIIKRYFRLSIPVAFVTLFVFFLQVFYYNIEVANLLDIAWIKDFSPCYSVKKLIVNVLLGVPCGMCDFLGVIWMVKYLFWGAFLVVILNFGIHKLKRIKANILLLLFAVISYKVYDLYTCVVLGVILEYNYKCFSLIRKRKSVILSLIFFVSSIILHMISNQVFSNVFSSFLIVISIMINPTIQLFLSNRIFQFLGKISFQAYLLHCPIIFSLSCFLYLYLPIEDVTMKMYLILVITIISVITVSFISYKYIETRFSEIIIKKIISFFKN